MLIWLDDSIGQALPTLTDSGHMGIVAILHAMVRGEHLVLGNREVFEKIASEPSLSQNDRKLAKAQASRLTQLGDVMSIVRQSVTVVHDAGPSLARSGVGWRIQLNHVGRLGLRPAMLLGEDVSDVQLLLEAARHYLVDQKLHRLLRPHADFRGAGGKANVERSFEVILHDSQAWCLCVTDSDRLTRHCGATALTNRIDALVANNVGTAVCGHHVLPTRELENIFPVHLISDAVESQESIEVKDAWRVYLNEFQVPSHIHEYVDLKEGTTLWSIKKLGTTGPARAIWNNEIARLTPVTGVETECSRGECKRDNNRQARCTCLITPAVSGRLADIVLNYLGKQGSGPEVVKRIKTSPNASGWLDLGKVVADWTCGTTARLT